MLNILLNKSLLIERMILIYNRDIVLTYDSLNRDNMVIHEKFFMSLFESKYHSDRQPNEFKI